MTYFMISILFSSILIIVTWIIMDVVDVLRSLLGSQFATRTLGLRNPSLLWVGGEGRLSEPEPELMLLVEELLDSGPRPRESLIVLALKPRPRPTPLPSQSWSS